MQILVKFRGVNIEGTLDKHRISHFPHTFFPGQPFGTERQAYIQEKQLLPLLGIIRLSGYQIEKTDKDYTFHIRSSSWAEE